MKIGVVSDTHNNTKNVREIVQIFNRAGVDKVVHTGDITTGKTLEMFADLRMPLFGVFGNNDVLVDSLNEVIHRHQFVFGESELKLNWQGRQVLVVHNPKGLTERLDEFDVALHGHTHMYRDEWVAPTKLIFNPGECAGQMSGWNAVGVVDLESLTTSLLKF